MKKRLNLVENTLKYITKKSHEEKGSEFLKQVAKYLSEMLKVNYVLINEYSKKEPNIVKTIAFYGTGGILPNITYKLVHTPCENVIDNKICIYPKNIQTLFPKDYLLAQMNAESYIGIPLWSSTGVPIGLIIILDDKEIKETKTISIVLQIVAIKVAQVIEKQLYENKLKRQIKDLELSNKKIKESENNLKDAQRIAKLGYWKLDIPTNKLTWSDEIYRIFGLKPQEFNPTYNGFLEKVHPEDRNKVNEAYQSSLKNKTPYKIEHRILLATGETKYLIEKCNTNYNDKGEPVSSIGTVLDITKQRESEERYRGFSEASFNAIFLTEKGVCLDQNATAKQLFGYTNKEAVGKLATEWVVPEDRTMVMNKILSGNEEPYEVRALRKDGTTFPAKIQAKMILYKGRNVRVTELSDITLHKQLEETLKKSEEKFKKLANLTFEGILIHKNGVVLDINLAFEKMFGYNLDEIYGKDITQIIYPKKYHKIILKNRIDKYTQAYEMEAIRKDGSIFPIEVEARNIIAEEALRVTAFRDITACKKSEKEYLKLFTAVEQSANTIVITDTEGNIEYTNPKFTELTGYTNKEALGQNPRILNSGIQPKSYYKKMWETITAGKIWNGEFRNKSKSGNLFWEKVTITPIKNKEGEIINYLAVKEDITNRKRADQELEKATNKIKESEKKFRELYEKSGDAILIIKNGIFVDCNQATVNMLGYNTKEEFLNLHPSKLSPKQQPDGLDSNEKANKMMQLALDHGTHRFEWIHTKKSKKNFPVEVLLTAISNEIENEIIHCVWRDISERKKAEENLNNAFELIKKSEEELNTILKTANEGFWMVNRKGVTIEVNPKMCDILGYSENEILGKSIFNFVDEENAKIFKKQLKIRDLGLPSTYEIELKHKNGNSLACLFKTSPVFNKKNIRTGSFAMVSDISTIKKAYNNLENKNKELRKLSDELSIKNNLLIENKNKFKNLFDKSPVSLWEQDFSEVIKLLNKKKSEGIDVDVYLNENQDFLIKCISKIKILNVNKTTLELLGVKDIEELVTHIRKTNNEISLNTIKKELISIISGEKEFFNETQLVNKNGDKLHVLVKSAMLNNKGKNLVSIINITALKKAEKELIKAKEKAEESDRLKTEFLNNMSHEIRTPMNGILGFTQMLNDPDLDDSKRQTFVNIIQNSGNQLLQIIDDILEISRLGTKQVKVINNEVCLNDLLLDLFSIFDIKAKENKTPLYLKKEFSDKQSTIITDKTKLNKIVSNLLENAIKYTNQGFIEFGYSIINKKDSSQIEIYVKDTGIGISPEKHQLIFNRFSQAEKEMSKKTGGLGLGLSIAKENTELLGGTISVQSKKMEGATFTIRLPYKPVFKNETIEKTKNSYNILIAEDEEVNYMYLETMLKDVMKLNCNVFHAKNGKEAVDFCKNDTTVDFVLMDLKMPVLNGYKATEQIRKFNDTLPIIAQTAYSTEQDKEKAFLAGCTNFISKPIDKEEFFDIINKITLNKTQ